MIDDIKLVLDVQSGRAFIKMWWSGVSLSVGGGPAHPLRSTK